MAPSGGAHTQLGELHDERDSIRIPDKVLKIRR